VLAVEEPAASDLAASGIPQIDEISEERYNSEKKKVAQDTANSTLSTPPRQMGNPLIPDRVAERAGSLTPTSSVDVEVEGVLSSETLETTDVLPPPEPILDEIEKTIKIRRPDKKE